MLSLKQALKTPPKPAVGANGVAARRPLPRQRHAGRRPSRAAAAAPDGLPRCCAAGQLRAASNPEVQRRGARQHAARAAIPGNGPGRHSVHIPAHRHPGRPAVALCPQVISAPCTCLSALSVRTGSSVHTCPLIFFDNIGSLSTPSLLSPRHHTTSTLS